MSDDTAAIQQLENALALQKKAFLKNQCPSAEERKANIGKIPVMVLSNRDAIREAMNKDFGSHPQASTDMVEILGVAGRAAYVISKIDEWMKYDSRDVDSQLYGAGKGEIRYQPKGVVGNIVRTYMQTIFRDSNFLLFNIYPVSLYLVKLGGLQGEGGQTYQN
jgi:coniferyl-aldehyde dehydrogenase